jgi:ABC-2 type transport system permease protein
MNSYRAALSAEVLKARRSAMPLLTLGVASAAGGIAALFMFILADPDRARGMGLLNQKAQLSGLTADWPGLLGFLGQLVAVGCLILFSFIAAWVFGREFADGTARYLLALPVARSTIVWAKFTVVAGWAAVVTVWLAGVVLAFGWALGLPGASADVVAAGLSSTAAAAVLMLLVTAPVALIASSGRGYLPPLASAMGAVVVGQVGATLGWGAVVPWSVPAVAVGLVPGSELGAGGLVVALGTGLLGVLGTAAWWRSGRAGA